MSFSKRIMPYIGDVKLLHTTLLSVDLALSEIIRVCDFGEVLYYYELLRACVSLIRN